MCQKCARKIGKAKIRHGLVKVLAHQIDAEKYACIPIFADKNSNLAVEGYYWKIRQAKTKRRYQRRER